MGLVTTDDIFFHAWLGRLEARNSPEMLNSGAHCKLENNLSIISIVRVSIARVKMSNEKNKKRSPFRMDFIQEVVKYKELEDGSMVATVKWTLNPKRYETIEINGEIVYKDKFTDYIIPISALEKMKFRQNAPFYCSPPKQEDYCSYLKKNKAELLEKWNQKYELKDKLEPLKDHLKKLKGRESRLVILYVDMEGSTRISSTVDSDTNLKIIKIFLMQMAKAIDNFRGYVLKFVGDCVIGIFPADENFTSMADNAIQSAMTMRSVVEDVINPVFAEKGLPEIGCHIGLDIGTVQIDRIGATDVAAFDDLIGYPMNLTAKIQSQAGHNEILIGRNLFELLHCGWQEHCEKIDLGKAWIMKDCERGNTYQVYRFNGKWVCKCWDN